MSSAHDLYARFRHLIHEVAKFGVVGGVGFVITLAGSDYLIYDAGMEKYAAVGVATVIATVVTFIGNRYWTFRHRERTGTARESVLFFVMNGVGILIQYACIGIIQDGLGLESRLWLNLANFLGIVLGTIFRFFSYRRWVWHAPITEILEDEHEALEPAAAAGPVPPGPAGGARGDEAGRTS